MGDSVGCSVGERVGDNVGDSVRLVVLVVGQLAVVFSA